MRYCRFCHRLSSRTAQFCRHCGKSFNLKHCPAGHLNSRGTVFCSTCGSTDLSEPQPRVSFGGIFLETFFFLLLLLGTLVYLGVFIRALLSNPAGLLPLMLIGLGIGLGWLLYVTVHSAWR
jgi:RNA polymerase subunit RPABC4/transcription elongation factor Spt4